jgi:hypothetical protein
VSRALSTNAPAARGSISKEKNNHIEKKSIQVRQVLRIAD